MGFAALGFFFILTGVPGKTVDSVGQGEPPMTWDTDHAQHSGKNKSMLLIHAKETYEDKGKAVVYV